MRNMGKITLRDSTVIEGTSEEIAELAERLNGEESELTSAQESELKTVNRSAEVGERILITDSYMTGGRYNNGDILTVVSIDSNDEEGVNVDANGMKVYVLHNEYEVIVEDEEDAIEEGDIVKLLSLSLNEATLSGFEVSDVCTVEYIYESPMKDTRLGVKKQDGRLGYCSPDNVVKLSDKIEVGDEVILDAGDDEDIRPLIGFYNGETYEVTDMNPERTDQEGDMISIGYNWGGHEGYPTLDQVKLVRKAEDKPEETKEFNVGDYAKVIGETYHDDISAGTIVKIYREKDVDGDYRVDLIDGSDHDYAQADSLERYEPSERDLQFLRAGRDIDEFKAGDI